MPRARSYDRAAMRADFASIGSYAEVARRHGCCYSTAKNVCKGNEDRRTVSRHASMPLDGRTARMPPFDHPALTACTTIYPATVVDDVRRRRALKDGVNSPKIGAVILKGRWRGFPVYTLTLEERATCPTSCLHWRSCYGNQMPFAHRLAAGADLEWRLEREVAALELAHPGGFAVRLHVLGDFYSFDYVDLWRALLRRHAALHVWGYTARVDPRDPITRTLAAMVREFGWRRFAMRFSDALVTTCSTVSVEHSLQAPEGAIVCPEQVGKTESCSTCALCWQTTRPIAFITH